MTWEPIYSGRLGDVYEAQTSSGRRYKVRWSPGSYLYVYPGQSATKAKERAIQLADGEE